MGRPTDCTPEVTARICKAIRVGMPLEHAAEAGGIHRSTFYRWMQRAEDNEQPYRDFRDAVERAVRECEERALRRISKAARLGSWQAAAWLLERRHPEHYGRRDRVQMDATVSGTHHVEVDATDKLAAGFRALLALSPEERAKLRGGDR